MNLSLKTPGQISNQCGEGTLSSAEKAYNRCTNIYQLPREVLEQSKRDRRMRFQETWDSNKLIKTSDNWVKVRKIKMKLKHSFEHWQLYGKG